MIQYSLKCAQEHRFDSWFQSAEAFDKLKSAGMITCAVCGSSDVEKAIMAPRVRPSRNSPSAQPDAPSAPAPDATPGPSLSAPASPAEQALAEMKRKIEQNSEYVGNKFVREARAMHSGDAPERAIYGEARVDEAKQLIDDGVPVIPLNFVPGRKTN
ncbi:hypothetical protein TG4357_01115 [Thalassovita gelatinovora]|uniref:DUF1178 family protein n=1 Tax=Thalassovita gelatinovora TaxID=53501 RepID=A0A0P1FSK2_THAGE|nr:DUF1178 family protein [Thalassovita gelatinovora]QIZ80278.1 DUF1178 family protein [Thalassovita gelatinovora]CUH64161.1 hypothetical protein TG4357_01115 [Thalassovita gelatinovora]SEQ84636.1 hypothetical protein SAMN04488043_109157 [Thalassovita gelatinovora]